MSQGTEQERLNAVGASESMDAEAKSRREVMLAIGKYSACIGASSFVVLSADEALARQPCSQHPRPRPGQNCDP